VSTAGHTRDDVDGGAEHGAAKDASGPGGEHAFPFGGDRATRVARIRAALEAALAPQALDVVDDSARHAGHAGARDGRGHFNVAVVSVAFAGMAPLARHRMVYAALGAMMESDIHALSIVARAPGEPGPS
jgi:BolA family transcriptional regulator, general stress-responsive regulator